MKFFQLFCDKPSKEFLVELLNCFNLKDLNDTKEFCKGELIEFNTVLKIEELIPELVLYYLPCKAKIYLSDMNEKRAITVLCQFLKLFDYKLNRKEKIVNKKKIIYYKLQKLEDIRLHISSFDNLELKF